MSILREVLRVLTGHEPAEFRHQANLALSNGLERVRAAEAAGNSSQESDTFTEGVDYRPVVREEVD